MTADPDQVSKATREAYGSALRSFSAWLGGAEWKRDRSIVTTEETSPRPAKVVLAFLTDMATQVDEHGRWIYSAATFRQTLAAINWDHARRGFQAPGFDPQIIVAMRKIQEERSAVSHVQPLSLEDLRKLLDTIEASSDDQGLYAARDRCLLLFTFAGSFLAQEVEALRIGDIVQDRLGSLFVTISAGPAKNQRPERITELRPGNSASTCAPCAFVRWIEVYGGGRSRDVEATARRREHVCDRRVTTLEPVLPLLPMTIARTRVGRTPLSRPAMNRALRRWSEEAGLVRLSMQSVRLGFLAEAFEVDVGMPDLIAHSGHSGGSSLSQMRARLREGRRPTSIDVGL